MVSGTVRGDGAGSVNYVMWGRSKANVELRDLRVNGSPVYQSTTIVKGTWQAGGRTGGRSLSGWATMKQVDIYHHNQSSTGGFVMSKVCENIALAPDKCVTKSGWL